MDEKQQLKLRQYIEAFYFGYREFTAQPDHVLEKRGLNRAHHRILYFIGRNPGIEVGGLLEILQITKQALNTPLRQLIEIKLVRNQTADFDRRVRQLTLTDSGKTLENQLTQLQMDLLDKALCNSPQGSGKQWLSVMQAMMDTNQK